jgi:hypothetical protein
MVLAHQVQAQVDCCRHPAGCQHVAFVDVEHVRHHLDLRVGIGKGMAIRPVGRCPAPFQQAGRGQHERAQTQRHHRAPPGRRGRPGGQHRVVRTLAHEPCHRQHDDGVGHGQLLQASVNGERKAAPGARPTTPLPADREVVPVRSKPPVDPEHLGHRPEIKRGRAVERKRRHPMPWHGSHDSCHSCHFHWCPGSIKTAMMRDAVTV